MSMEMVLEGNILQIMATLLKLLPMDLIKHLVYFTLILCKPDSTLRLNYNYIHG